jgi:hypothetical protein
VTGRSNLNIALSLHLSGSLALWLRRLCGK